MNVKKQYVELHDLLASALEAKPKVQLATLMPQILELMQTKTAGGQGSTFKKDEDGNVTHVFCYYHKVWEDVSEVPYGIKTNTATGLNTMCKAGVSAWSKQQRIYTKTRDELLNRLAQGEEIDLAKELAEAEEARKAIN